MAIFGAATARAAFSWTIQNAGGIKPALLFEGSLPRIAYAESNQVKLAIFDGANWLAAETVAPAGALPSLARNPVSGNLQIAYKDNGDIYYATRTGSGWTREPATTNQPSFDPSARSPNLAVDATGIPHLGFGGPLNGGNADYSYATKLGGVWSTELVEGPGQPFTAEHSALALDSGGMPAIVYNGHTNGVNYGTRFVRRVGGVWTAPEFVSHAVAAPGNTLKFDPSDAAHVAYLNDGTLVYATRASNGTWSAETAATGIQNGVFSLSLVLHPVTGTPFISFLSGSDNDHTSPGIAYRQGDVWVVEIIASNVVASGTAIALDASASTLGVAYDGKYAFASISTNLAIVTASGLPAGTVGTLYSNRLQSANGVAPLSWTLTGGGLPPNLLLSPVTGAITGTPTASGITNFTIKVTDAHGSNTSRAFTLTINAAPSISTATLTAGVAGVAYQQTISATGGTPPLVWSVISGGLPNGLTLDPGTGRLYGTPANATTTNFTIQIQDANGAAATRALSLTLNATLAITTSSPLPTGTVGATYQRSINAVGGISPYSWAISAGGLPAGLTLNTTSGLISGVPTQSVAANVTIQVSDSSSNTTSQAFSLSVNAAVVITATTPILSGNLGSPYSQSIAVTGGTAPLTWSIIAGTLPAGLGLNPANGLLSGTPTAATNASFTIQVADANSGIASKAFLLVIFQTADAGHGGLLFTNSCNSCHAPAGNVLHGASRLRLQDLATGRLGHLGGTSPFTGASLSDLAAFISSKDANQYQVTGRITNSLGGISSVTVAARSSYLNYSFPITSQTSSDGTYTLSGLPAGDHLLTPSGAGFSYSPADRSISVFAAAAPVTNQNFQGTATLPPMVRFTGPTSGSSYTTPANILLTVNASDPDGTVVRVEYFAGATSLGVATNAPFSFTWTNPTSGSYPLRAVAMDNNGATAVSGLLRLQVSTAYNPLSNGLTLYNQSCFACHGVAPPGSNPGLGALNNEILIAANKYVLLDSGVVANFPPHTNTVAGVAVTSFVLGLTDQQRTDLATYIASCAAIYGGNYTITGRVETTAYNGTGVAGATVYLDGYNPRLATLTDANGYYGFSGVRRGDYTLTIAHPSFDFSIWDQSRSVPLYANLQVATIYGARQRTAVVGSARDLAGHGATDTHITIAGNSTTNVAFVDADGFFSLLTPPGSYTVSIAPNPLYGFTPATRNVTVDAGADGLAVFTAIPLVVRVSLAGSDANDGLSWATAKQSVQAALDAAPPGGEVWAMAGTYYERINLFGRALYGGFAGNETVRDQRNWPGNITTLNGNPIILGQLGLSPGNMVIIDDDGTNIARLDGMQIINGRATSPSHGGGVHIKSYAGPVIANNRLAQNVAGYGGGGIYVGASSTAVIVNNQIEFNHASTGGGVYCDYGSRPVLIANNLIAENTADSGAGGVAIYGYVGLFANNTIAANVTTNGQAGGLHCGFGSSTNVNNIIAFNIGGSGIYQTASFVGTNHHNCVYGNSISNYDGLVPAPTDILANPAFASGYRLLPGSPCIDAGSDNEVTVGTVDIDGTPRIQRAHVDIGADEVPPFAVVSGLGSGSLNLTWPAAEIGFTLEYSTNLASQLWYPVIQPAVTNGPNQTIAVEFSGPGRFFRLKK
jgi:mono/diheme cytochrome c family protein